MTETRRVFCSCVLHKEYFEDDLGHLFRAGTITEDGIVRTIWLRVLDGPGLPTDEIITAFADARVIGETMTGGQAPAMPLFFEADGVPALGCDFTPGQPLNRVLARARDEAFPLQPENSLLIVEKIALALAMGSAAKVSENVPAHGFLHPGLIYLSNDGEAVVTGFGVGRALVGGVFEPGSATGCCAYLAPEVLAGRAPSSQGDVYSLGAILFHLLTGTALPQDPEERAAALSAARSAWDGEQLPSDILAVLSRSLAPTPEKRFGSAPDLRSELDRLIYGGAYSPTTFNLALFMDRLFRSEIDEDELALQQESELDLRPLLAPGTEELGSEPDNGEPKPKAIAPVEKRGAKNLLRAAIGAAAIIGIASLIFWAGRGTRPQQELTPTPTAAEITLSRRAQEDRLRAMTQEMVQQMMAEREEEIRQELIARQTRIEELQLRLQRSERRAAQSAAAAATESETQERLMREIKEQEEAQRAQQDRLEAELEEATTEALDTKPDNAAALADAVDVSGEKAPVAPATSNTEAEVSSRPLKSPSPTSSPRPQTDGPVTAPVKFGAFVAPDDVDTLPVVLKSQSLIWPRNAQRSKGKGVVVVKLRVNANGGVDDVEVLRVDHPELGIAEAAVDAAAGYRFKPGTKDGVAVTTDAFVTWRYDFTAE